jgi:hypothetical protein
MARPAGERRPSLGIDQGARHLMQKKEGAELLLTQARIGRRSGAGRPESRTSGGARTALGEKVAESGPRLLTPRCCSGRSCEGDGEVSKT